MIVASPTMLLVDLRLFELLRQLVCHIRSSNCILCAPQADRNCLVVLGGQLCTEIKAL